MPSRLERDSLISPRTHLLQTSCEEINVFARSISPLKLCYAATEYTFAHCSFATDFFSYLPKLHILIGTVPHFLAQLRTLLWVGS